MEETGVVKEVVARVVVVGDGEGKWKVEEEDGAGGAERGLPHSSLSSSGGWRGVFLSTEY